MDSVVRLSAAFGIGRRQPFGQGLVQGFVTVQIEEIEGGHQIGFAAYVEKEDAGQQDLKRSEGVCVARLCLVIVGRAETLFAGVGEDVEGKVREYALLRGENQFAETFALGPAFGGGHAPFAEEFERQFGGEHRAAVCVEELGRGGVYAVIEFGVDVGIVRCLRRLRREPFHKGSGVGESFRDCAPPCGVDMQCKIAMQRIKKQGTRLQILLEGIGIPGIRKCTAPLQVLPEGRT